MPPLFDSGLSFVILAIIMALAGYLRQVGAAAQELADKIEKRDAGAPFPWDKSDDDAISKKLDFQRRFRRSLAILTHILFCVMFIMTVRIGVFSENFWRALGERRGFRVD
jgi:hypothetical protein